MPTPKYSPLRAQVRSDQIYMVYQGAPLALLSSLLNSSVLAVVIWPAIGHAVALTWVGIVWALSALRAGLTVRFWKTRPGVDAVDGWARAALLGAILSGVTWGAAGHFLFVPDSLPHQVFLSFVIAGMVTGAVVTLSVQLPAAISFVLLSTTPALFHFYHETHEFAPAMCFMVLLFIVMMLFIARGFSRHLTAMFIERYERRQAQQRDRARNQVLELLARGAPLARVLETVVANIEQENPQMLCSILLLDETEQHLLTGAAPSLPDFYNTAVHGLKIGPDAGSCGTAAYTGERVIVEDIQQHPYWTSFKEIASQAGLRACWSEPVFSSSGKLLGTLATYHRDAHAPTDQEIAVIEHAANLAGIAAERHQNEEALQLAALVYQNTSEAMVITDQENRIIAINPAFTQITGYTLDEVTGRNPRILASAHQDAASYQAHWQELDTTGRWQGEMWGQRKKGDEFAEWLTINTIYDKAGTVHRRVAMFSDITERKEADALIWTQANYDDLTGLPNRRLFADRLEHALRTAHREKSSLALLYIDLDRFKEVNDALGHHIGDELLVEAARRIKGCVRESDTVARLGGDEFTVILAEPSGESGIGHIALQIIDTLSKPYHLSAEEAFTSASIGITVYPDDATQPEELLKNADQAMFAAKQDGRNRFSYFTKSMQEATQQRMRLVRDIHQALIDEQFSVHFQPIVELASGRIHKAEALLRWRHPQTGFISPATFIPIAEETGAIHEIGNRVFRESAQRVKHWRTRYDPHFQVSVNKSPVQFLAGDMLRDDWVEYLQELGLSGDGIAIEITEGVLLRAAASIDDELLRLRDAGFQVAIDDFGTGYSSLAYLKRFDIDYLKLDQSFVKNLESDASDLALSEAIVVMAHKLGFKVIAEGVETEAQRDILTQIGCDYAQGFYFSRPIPAEAFEELLQDKCGLGGQVVPATCS